MKFLLVDDDARLQLLLKKYLDPYGISVSALNGAEAIRLFREAIAADAAFDVVFMDINMPDMGGPQVVDELRIIERTHGVDESSGFKLVMISAYAETMAVCKTVFHGSADAYIAKPFKKKAFIEELVQRHILPES